MGEQCACTLNGDTRCMLPARHEGQHVAHVRWDNVPTRWVPGLNRRVPWWRIASRNDTLASNG